MSSMSRQVKGQKKLDFTVFMTASVMLFMTWEVPGVFVGPHKDTEEARASSFLRSRRLHDLDFKKRQKFIDDKNKQLRDKFRDDQGQRINNQLKFILEARLMKLKKDHQIGGGRDDGKLRVLRVENEQLKLRLEKKEVDRYLLELDRLVDRYLDELDLLIVKEKLRRVKENEQLVLLIDYHIRRLKLEKLRVEKVEEEYDEKKRRVVENEQLVLRYEKEVNLRKKKRLEDQLKLRGKLRLRKQREIYERDLERKYYNRHKGVKYLYYFEDKRLLERLELGLDYVEDLLDDLKKFTKEVKKKLLEFEKDRRLVIKKIEDEIIGEQREQDSSRSSIEFVVESDNNRDGGEQKEQ